MSYDELISEVVLVRFRSLAPPILLLMAAGECRPWDMSINVHLD